HLPCAQHFRQHPLFTAANLLAVGGQQVNTDSIGPPSRSELATEAFTGEALQYTGRLHYIFRLEVRRNEFPQLAARLLAHLAWNIGAHKRSQFEIFIPGIKGNFFGAKRHEPRAKQVQQERHERIKTAGTVQQLSGAVGHGVISSDLVNQVMLVTQGYRAITPGLQVKWGFGRMRPAAEWRSSSHRS